MHQAGRPSSRRTRPTFHLYARVQVACSPGAIPSLRETQTEMASATALAFAVEAQLTIQRNARRRRVTGRSRGTHSATDCWSAESRGTAGTVNVRYLRYCLRALQSCSGAFPHVFYLSSGPHTQCAYIGLGVVYIRAAFAIDQADSRAKYSARVPWGGFSWAALLGGVCFLPPGCRMSRRERGVGVTWRGDHGGA